ncbi:MAG: UDP-N-acetylglucosamine 2-epimerase (non-hydrolyzing) [Planctomycetes bacterium]|nr:UDP-N-acetylglucosamine 2-epimerase (non-hydrolyzing) [Planctomycetota bacterium]
MKIVNVVGARPNFMKVAPIMAAYRGAPSIEPVLVHTGQHYDERMSDLFFRELGIPEPDVNLEVGSGSHARQTAEIMVRFEEVVLAQRPAAVLVVGDVNSTIACGLVAVKLGVKLVHVEAGLRSFDRGMPEEINRVLTDSISDLLFCTEQSGMDNLAREGLAADRCFLVGNCMVDTLLKNLEKARQSRILEELRLEPRGFVVVTLHRPSNVDDERQLGGILDALREVQQDYRVVFPVHPRTRKMLERDALRARVAAMPNLLLLDPAGYLDFVRLCDAARLVLTDSGGIQEETTIMGVPCLTLRHNTERPVTCTVGTNQLVGNDPARILDAYHAVLSGAAGRGEAPPLWDGRAAERIVAILAERLAS